MTWDRAHAESLWAGQRQERTAARRPQLEMLAQASLKAEHVTGHPAWDQFLTFIQAAIERERKALVSHETTLRNPLIVAHNDMLAAKVALVRCQERIWAWEAVMAIPAALIEGGERARALLAEVENG